MNCLRKSFLALFFGSHFLEIWSNSFQIFAKLWFGKFEENVVLGRVMYSRLHCLVVIT